MAATLAPDRRRIEIIEQQRCATHERPPAVALLLPGWSEGKSATRGGIESRPALSWIAPCAVMGCLRSRERARREAKHGGRFSRRRALLCSRASPARFRGRTAELGTAPGSAPLRSAPVRCPFEATAPVTILTATAHFLRT